MSHSPFVAILMGSDSDLPVVQAAIDVLDAFGVAHEVRVSSAHRTPAATHDYVTDADARGCAVFIAAAGMAAHLAGAIAGLTTKPVVGVPIAAGPLNGFDALLATVQMPGGVPVATMAIGKAGAKNAGYFSLQVLALNNPELAQRLAADRAASADAILAKNVELGFSKS